MSARGVSLSPIQEAIWAAVQQPGGDRAYNLAFALDVAGDFDRRGFHAAWRRTLERHALLRARIDATHPLPRLVVTPYTARAYDEIDLAAKAAADARAGEVAADLAAQPVDPTADPLSRALVIRVAPDRHVAVVVVHHIVFDRRSQDVVIADLASAYADSQESAYADSENSAPPVLPPLPSLDDAAADQLADLLPAGVAPLRLPTSGVGANDGAAGAVDFLIPRDVRSSLAARAATAGSTVFSLLAASVQLAVHSYGNAVSGTTVVVDVRDATERDGIGPFVNNIPLFLRFDATETVGEAVAASTRLTHAALRLRRASFARLADRLGARGVRGAEPLFQVVLSYRRPEQLRVRFGGADAAVRTLHNGGAKCDLFFEASDDGAEIAVRLQHRAAAFAPERAHAIADHIVEIAEAVATAPDRALAQLPAPRWRRTGARGLRGPARAARLDPWHAFAAHALRAPERPALVAADEVVTYGEVTTRAEAVAAALTDGGCGAGDVVGIHARPTPDVCAAVLGVLRAGACYLPLDPTYPAERLSFMVHDAGARVVLSDAGLPWKPDAASVKVLPLRPSVARRAVAPGGGPGGVAYVIYTSGSTGRPKGVAVSRCSVANLLASMRDLLHVGAADRVLFLTSLAFDISVLEMLLPLATGGCCLVSGGVSELGTPAFATLLAQATLVQATPSTWRLLLDANVLPPATTRAISGGEELTPELAERLRSRHDTVWNLYGPTETTVWSLAHRVGHFASGRVPLGQPIANTQVYVVGGDGHVFDDAATGELFIGGAGVALGYVNRPRLTAERFVPNPFADATCAGSRLYATGDVVRLLDDAVEFRGRADTQVKLRGYRIELGEVEAVCREHPRVTAAVAAVESTAAASSLVAYVEFDEAAPDMDDLAAYLASRLPPYMCPTTIVPIDEWPLTPNKKIDRGALRHVAGAPPPGMEPTHALADTVVDSFRTHLPDSTVDAKTGFFELGGNSLVAARVAADITRRTGIAVSVPDVLSAASGSALAAALARRRVELLRRESLPFAPDLEPLPRADARARWPVSFGQEERLGTEAVSQSRRPTGVGAAFAVDGPLDVDALSRAAAAVVARHEALRTRLVASGHGWEQVIEPVNSPDVRVARAPNEAAAVRIVERLGREAFAPATPLRVIVVQIDAAAFVVGVVADHMAADAYALRIVCEEIGALYGASRSRRGTRLPPPPRQFKDYAAWERAAGDAKTVATAVASWRARLGDLHPHGEVPLPVLYAPPEVRSRRHRSDTVRIGAADAAAMRALARRCSTTPYVVLMTLLQAALADASGSARLAVVVSRANRTRPGTEGLVGWLADTVLVRGRADPRRALADVVRDVQVELAEALALAVVPHRLIARELAAATGYSTKPRVVFSYLPLAFAPRLDLKRIASRALPVRVGPPSRGTIAIEAVEAPDGGVALRAVTEADRFEPGLALRILRTVAAAAARAGEPNARVSDLLPSYDVVTARD